MKSLFSGFLRFSRVWMLGALLCSANRAAQIDVVSRPYTNVAHVFGSSSGIELSADGKLAVFNSDGNGLATNDNNGLTLDLFLRDLQSGETTLISRNTEGASANSDSVGASISADGRLVVFESDADDLVPNDQNESTDVFLFDRDSKKLRRISGLQSQDANGFSGAASITRNGRFILFESDAPDLSDIDNNAAPDLFLHDLTSDETRLVTVNSNSTAAASAVFPFPFLGNFEGSVSEDGRYVAYLSSATNVIRGIPSNSEQQLFLRDMVEGTNYWISRTFAGQAGKSVSSAIMSTNGAYLVFLSSNLSETGSISSVYLHLYSSASNSVTRLPLGADEFSMSADGKWIVYTAANALYLYETASAQNKLIADGPIGTSPFGNPLISDNGQTVVFTSSSTNLVSGVSGAFFQLFSYDVAQGKFTLLTRNQAQTDGANRDILFPALSADGSTSGFMSFASDLVSGDEVSASDVFTVAGSGNAPVQLASQPIPGAVSSTANHQSDVGLNSLSLDGSVVVFSSLASDLVPNDDNESTDIFLRDLRTGNTRLVSLGSDGLHPFPSSSSFLSMSRDGRMIAFAATNFPMPGRSIYVYDGRAQSNYVASLLPSGETALATEGNLSADGRFLSFRTFSGTQQGIFVRDLIAKETRFVTNNGNIPAQQFMGVSPGGKYLVMYPTSGSLRLTDWQTGSAIQLSAVGVFGMPMTADDSAILVYTNLLLSGPLYGPNLYLHSLIDKSQQLIGTNAAFGGISADGSTIAYQQRVSNTVFRLLVHDVKSGVDQEIPFANPDPAFRIRQDLQLSGDGRFIAFTTMSPISAASDQNEFNDVFVYDRVLTNLTLVSHTSSGNAGEFGSSDPSISADGRTITFQSSASDLIANDRNLASDVFVAHLPGADSDADGLEDGWELVNFGNLVAGALEDGDNDGANNLEEFHGGTDPKNDASLFQLQMLAPSTSDEVALQWSTVLGKSYQLQYCDDLKTDGWRNLGDPVTAFGHSVTFRTQTDAKQSGFYRVQALE